MEQQKDIQKTDSLSKFVETQSIKTSPFADNRMGERIYRRVEKIAAALILVTNHVSNTEPLRVRARTTVTSLISVSLDMRDDMRALNSEHVRTFKSTCRELISLVRLLAVGGEVSIQNADVISEAIDELSVFLTTSQRSTLSESVSFTKDDLTDTRDVVAVPRKEPLVKSESHPKPSQENSIAQFHKPKPTSNVSPSKASVEHNGALSSRSLVILEVLRPGGQFSIRDITAHLPEYSEKMIQRELAVLVSAGKVTKVGEKRWSRYAIASQG